MVRFIEVKEKWTGHKRTINLDHIIFFHAKNDKETWMVVGGSSYNTLEIREPYESLKKRIIGS